MPHTSNNRQAGFSISELAVAIFIATVVVVGLLALLFRFTTISGESMTSVKQVQAVTTALHTIENDVVTAKAFLATSSISDVNDSNPATPGAWSFTGADEDSRVLLLRNTITTRHASNLGRDVVYIAAGGCPIGTQPASLNIVYYLKDSSLYRRVVLDNVPESTYCSGQTPFEKRTCTEPGASGSPANCTQRDVEVASGIESFSIDYYANASDANPNDGIYTASDPQGALDTINTIRVTLSVGGGSQDDHTSQIRLSRSNYR